MNVFNTILARDAENETRLGVPLADQAARSRRMNTMFTMTGGKGFYTPPAGVRVWGDGTTRGERKRKRRTAMWLKIMNEQGGRAERIVARSGMNRAVVRQWFGSVYV